MKSLLLLPLIVLPLLLTGCETVVVDRHPHRGAYVERDVVVDRYPRRDLERDYPRRDGYYDRDVVVENRRPRRDTVVIETGRPLVEVRYYTDSHGRYYIKNGRRIYVRGDGRYY